MTKKTARHGLRIFRSMITRLAAIGCAMVLVTLLAVPDASAVSFRVTRTTPIRRPSMRVVVVRAAGDCRSSCPEWISAEGLIAPESPAEFSRVLASIGHRRLPVFIHSVGGNVVASLAIGRMLRAHHLPVSVTRTRFASCSPGSAACDDAPGTYIGVPSSYGAFCASACAFLIAGGERRFVSPGSLVGVHEIALVLPTVMTEVTMTTTDARGREIELGHRSIVVVPPKITQLPQVTQELISTSMDKFHGKLAQYYREMGMSDQLITLALATKPPAIHWMTRPELSETGLMTDAVGGEVLVGLQPTQAVLNAPAPAYAAAGPTHDRMR